MRLIDADKLVSILHATSNMVVSIEVQSVLDHVAKMVEKMPAVDAVLVRHGRWEVYFGGKELMCSSCKTTFFDEEQVGGSNYCPKCGAKMDGGNEDEKEKV